MKSIKDIIILDLYRYCASRNKKSFVKHLYASPGFKFLFFFRLAQYYNRKTLHGFIFYQLYKKYSIKYGFQIPLSVKIGEGLAMPHFGNIVVNSKAQIGSNCNILHGVTLGNNRHGKTVGAPIIGNNVFIGPGAAIIGGIKIGDNSLIAANSYVNINIPADSIVLGNPCIIIASVAPSFKHIINSIHRNIII